MRIDLHIGVLACGVERVQAVLDARRDQLLARGVLVPRSPGRKNHTRLYMAATDPETVDTLRWNRGYATAAKHALLVDTVSAELLAEVRAAAPDRVVLTASQLCGLARRSELERLRDILAPLEGDVRVIAHVDEPARLLARHYAEQVILGRTAPLDVELELADDPSPWRAACLARWPDTDPSRNAVAEVQAPPFWLDYAALVRHWSAVFGTVKLAPMPMASDDAGAMTAAFDLPGPLGRVSQNGAATPPSAEALARARALNHYFTRALDAGRIIPRWLWRRMLAEVAVPGAPINPGSLAAVSNRFAPDLAALADDHPGLESLAPPPPADPWREAAPTRGFRASQYMTVFLPRIDKVTVEERASKAEALAELRKSSAPAPTGTAATLTEAATQLLPPLAQANFPKLATSRFAPHNRIGAVDEEQLAAPFKPRVATPLPDGSSGTVVVGCMKNEGPYILEWVAYHRAIGVDNFLIYTNGCEDGTDEILGRLQDLGLLQHRLNDDWKGNSPQQHALNRALKEPLIRNAAWIAHIDVDEFMNIRCGNGTLEDFHARAPDATNVAMTWRLFGHNGVTALRDAMVIDQFDTCAPKYCPKPHTVWGFKTLFRNIGAYEKISCHRPNKLEEARRAEVTWVNGSGLPMGEGVKDKGWRSEVKSIGYDLIQLNHYALRSAESFLIKRQRGRALHVDRSIGLNYWVRMDWSDHRDVTIKRNIPRVHAELDRLLADPTLRRLHDESFAWHTAKAAELHAQPEFAELYQQALATRLTGTERVAYALALDLES